MSGTLYVKTRHGGKSPGDLTAEEQKEALDELIGMYAGAQEAEQAEARRRRAQCAPRAGRQERAMAELLYKKFTEGSQPTDAELKAEYDARIAEAPKQEYHARHILVDDEAKAKDLIAQLDKGASFEKLAKDNSKDGSIGRRRRPRLVQPEPDGQAFLGRRSSSSRSASTRRLRSSPSSAGT